MSIKNPLILLTATLAVSTFAEPAGATQRQTADGVAPLLARIACRSVHRFRHCGLVGSETDAPADGIRRSQYHLQVGPGEFDTITVHRVTTDATQRRRKALLLLPGTGLDVENIYLPGINSSAVADDFSPLVHAARAGIDAWSADYRGSDLPARADLPEPLQDYSFMADWGLATAASDMQLALRFARLVRLFSGDGFRRIHVGGYSAGVSVAFALASADAQRHRGRRDVAGIVAVDDTFDIDPAMSEDACMQFEAIDADIANGVFFEDQSFIITAATLARDLPDEPSPFGIPGTNLDFFNFITVVPFGPTPFHIFGGRFDDPFSASPDYTDQGFAIDQGTLFEPALPLQFSRELAEVRCRAETVSALDGGLAEITVPVLHIGAAGGNGDSIDYTLGRISSTDITTMLVQVLPGEPPIFDYGHGDVFAARDANVRVWQPIVDWIDAR